MRRFNTLLLVVVALAAFAALSAGRAQLWTGWARNTVQDDAPGDPRSPAEDLHWSPAENLEAIDVGLIDAARTRIDMAAFVLTDRAVIAALRRAAARGVAIRLVLDPGELAHETYADFDALRATPGVASKVKRGRVLMHLKSYAIDGALLRTGSANFSASGLKQQDNELLVTRDGAAVGRFETMYAGLFDAAE